MLVLGNQHIGFPVFRKKKCTLKFLGLIFGGGCFRDKNEMTNYIGFYWEWQGCFQGFMACIGKMRLGKMCVNMKRKMRKKC